MKRIISIGSATIDLFLLCKEGTELPAGAKIEVAAIHEAVGGGAANTAVAFTRMGYAAIPIAKIGKDEAGRTVIAQLRKKGVDTDHIIASEEAQTSRSFIIPAANGERTVLVHHGAHTLLNQKDISLDVLTHAAGVYVTSLSGSISPLAEQIIAHAKKVPAIVTFNPGSTQLIANDGLWRTLRNVDIFMVNAREAQILFPQNFSLETASKELLSRGPRYVIITSGAEGVYVAHNNTLLFHKTLSGPVNNTVGAGDAFGAAFSAAIIEGLPVETATIWGILNSASVVSAADAQQGLLSREQLEKGTRQLGATGLQKILLK